MAKIKIAIKAGAETIYISWGENRLDFELYRGQWIGHGWIRGIGGDDIAQELNRAQSRANNATLNLWNS